MKRKALLVFCILVALLTAWLLSLTASAENQNCVLNGRVVDEEGFGIEDALVIIANKPYLTDFAGRYVAYNLAPGCYNITIRKEGYIPKTESVELRPGETKDLITTLTKPKPGVPANDLIVFMLACLGAGIVILGGIFMRKLGSE